jgi:hypothetical protein
MEANGDGAAADPSEIRPALAQLAATSLDAMQRALLDAGVELPVPDVFATAFMNEITAIQREAANRFSARAGWASCLPANGRCYARRFSSKRGSDLQPPERSPEWHRNVCNTQPVAG